MTIPKGAFFKKAGSRGFALESLSNKFCPETTTNSHGVNPLDEGARSAVGSQRLFDLPQGILFFQCRH